MTLRILNPPVAAAPKTPNSQKKQGLLAGAIAAAGAGCAWVAFFLYFVCE